MHVDQANDPEDKTFLNTHEAGQFLRLKSNTLEKMRVYGGGPQYRKHGRYVFYHVAELRAWSEMRRKDWTDRAQEADSRHHPSIDHLSRPSAALWPVSDD